MTSRLARLAPSVGGVLAALAIATVVPGCARAPGARGALTVREITPSFLLDRDARDASIATNADGIVALTWVARTAGIWLAISRDSGTTFAVPVRVDEPLGRIVSFPEARPALALGPGGALAVAWSEHRADSTGAIDLRMRGSADLGRTLGGIVTVNDDASGPPRGLPPTVETTWRLEHRPDAFHAYPALAFTSDGALVASWLDSRRTPRGADPRVASLYTAVSLDGGQSWGANLALSDSACPCCRPALAADDDGAIALAYRAGSDDARDPVMALSRDGGRTFDPAITIARDAGHGECPDDGPAVVWDMAGGQYVWFTGAEPSGVYHASWRVGRGVGMRQLVSDTLVEPRHGLVASLADGSLIAVECRADDSDGRQIGVRWLDRAGGLGPWVDLGAHAEGGSIASGGAGRGLVCWTERDGAGRRVRIAEIRRR